MKKNKILLVEDDRLSARTLEKTLSKLGYEIIDIVPSGESAIESVSTEQPHLILMDIHLDGEIDGITAAERINSDYDIPIVFLSSNSDQITLNRARKTKPYGYIKKPFDPGELETTVAMALYHSYAVQRMKESEGWLKATLTGIGEGVISINSDATVEFLNPIAEQLTGWTRKEALGIPLQKILNIEDKEQDKLTAEIIETALSQGRVYSSSENTILYNRDGGEIPVYLNASPIREEQDNTSGVVIVFRDLLESKLAKEALEESERDYRRVVENANESITVAQDGKLKFFNKKTLELTGYSFQELEKLEFIELIHPDDREMVINKHKRRLDGEHIESVYNFRIIDKQGNVHWLEINAVLIEWQNRPATLNFLNDITDRVKAERAIKDSEKRLADIINFLPDATFAIDKDGVIIAWNQAMAALTEKTAEEMIGKDNYEYSVPIYGKRRPIMIDIVLDRTGSQTELYQEYHWDGDTLVAEVFIPVFRGGRHLWAKARPLYDSSGEIIGAIESIRDITNRKQAEEKLRLNQAAIEAANEGIAILDKKGRFIYLNKTYAKLFGYDNPEELNNRIWQTLFGKYETRKIENRIFSQLWEKYTWRGEIKGIRQDASEFPMEISLTLIENGNIVCIARDLSEQKEAEEIQRLLKEQLTKAEKMESLGLLAGGVAHDLNNILAPLVAYPDLIMPNIPENNPARKQIRRMGNSAQEAVEIIRDLLTLARRGRYEMEPTNLNNVIEKYLDSPSFIKLCEDHPNIEVEIDLSEDLGVINGSTTHLSKVVMNLIVNAFDAMPEKGHLKIETHQQYLSNLLSGHGTIKKGDYIILSVKDKGVGISPEDIEKIFEPYYSNKKMGSSGTGLGLAVVYGIIKDHKGYYDILSEVGKGTEFLLYFPVSARAEDKNPAEAKGYGGEETILIVDDNEEHREITYKLLASMGYDVATVNDGREALKYLAVNQIDLVVLDMHLDGDFDGLDTFREMKKINSNLKAVIMSGYPPNERVEEIQKMGAVRYIRKPFSREILTRSIREELDGVKAPATS